MPGPEKKVEAGFTKWCKERSVPCLKLADVGRRGWPDRTLVLPNGKFICIEFKSPTGTLDPMQVRTIALLQRNNVPVLVTSDKQEAIDFLTEHMNAVRSGSKRTKAVDPTRLPAVGRVVHARDNDAEPGRKRRGRAAPGPGPR